jgi:DNA-binding beta-propeller fold protein YncE
MDVAVNTKTNRVYVTNWLGRKVHVLGLINPQTKEHAMVTEIKAASGAAALTGWHGITVDETHNLIYAARFFVSGTPHVHAVAVIDGTTNTIIRTITHPALVGPIDVALNAAGTRLYVAMLGSNSGTSPTPLGVAVFDVDSATGAATFNTKIQTRSNPTAIVANHQRNQVYVTIAAGVQIIDGETLRITSTVPTGRFAQSVAVSTASNHICVGDGVEGTLTRVPVPALDTLTPWT